MKILLLTQDIEGKGGVGNYFDLLKDKFTLDVDYFITGKRHDEKNPIISHLLLEMTLDPSTPTPFGVLRAIEEPTYDELLSDQIKEVKKLKGDGTHEDLFYSGDVWEVE